MFEWDEAKRASNLLRHGVDFAAAEGFDFEASLILIDDRRDYGEVRHVALGPIADRLHVMVFVIRGERLRIVSLRRANAREVKAWQDRNPRL